MMDIWVTTRCRLISVPSLVPEGASGEFRRNRLTVVGDKARWRVVGIVGLAWDAADLGSRFPDGYWWSFDMLRGRIGDVWYLIP